MLKKIYTDSLLKYPLNNTEYKIIDKVWEWLEKFNTSILFVSDYRKKIITLMRNNYTIKEFQLYEEIVEKFFWNLRWILFPLFYYPNMKIEDYERFVKDDYNGNEELPHGLLLCNIFHYSDKEDLKDKIEENKLLKNNYYRSFINKIFIIDKKTKRIIYKQMEGSSIIFGKNYFNLLTSVILSNRSLYEKIMRYPYNIKKQKIQLPEFYYEHDYAFPNLNYCMYKINTNEERNNRIYKMYYHKESEKYWFKLLK